MNGKRVRKPRVQPAGIYVFRQRVWRFQMDKAPPGRGTRRGKRSLAVWERGEAGGFWPAKPLVAAVCGIYTAALRVTKYQSFTSASFMPRRFSASSTVAGGGTMTGSPGCQPSGVATLYLSVV